MSLIERLKLESELKSTVSIGKLFQRFMTRSAKNIRLKRLRLHSLAIKSKNRFVYNGNL